MKSKIWITSFALLALAAPVPAAATLGEDVTSVQADQAQMQGTLQITSAGKFAVHQIQLPSGGVVKEFVSPAGMVFAVSWKGPWLPDLQQVLGRYFERYTGRLTAQDGGPTSRRSQGSELVVQNGGHMRAFFGKAYVPQMLPRGVLAEEVQ